MYVYVDDRSRITACNTHDMTGNTGWQHVPEKVGEPITNTDDVPLYKYVNGHAVSRTPEEIAADTPAPEPPAPDRLGIIEQRLDEQDDALIELAELISGGE